MTADQLTAMDRDVAAAIARHRDCCCQATLDTLTMLADLAVVAAMPSPVSTGTMRSLGRDALEQAATVLGDES